MFEGDWSCQGLGSDGSPSQSKTIWVSKHMNRSKKYNSSREKQYTFSSCWKGLLARCYWAEQGKSIGECQICHLQAFCRYTPVPLLPILQGCKLPLTIKLDMGVSIDCQGIFLRTGPLHMVVKQSKSWTDIITKTFGSDVDPYHQQIRKLDLSCWKMRVFLKLWSIGIPQMVHDHAWWRLGSPQLWNVVNITYQFISTSIYTCILNIRMSWLSNARYLWHLLANHMTPPRAL